MVVFITQLHSEHKHSTFLSHTPRKKTTGVNQCSSCWHLKHNLSVKGTVYYTYFCLKLQYYRMWLLYFKEYVCMSISVGWGGDRWWWQSASTDEAWDRPIPSRKEAEMMISGISRLPLTMGVYSNYFLQE